MIFLSVGTQFNFDRLVKAIDQAVGNGLIAEEIFAQIGPAEYIPQNFQYVETLTKEDYEDKLSQATAIISHAGMGSITTALKYNKPLLVMPRIKKYGELVNDHQLDTAEKFEHLGHVLAAYSIDQLPEKIEQLKNFKPTPRTPDPEKLISTISDYLDKL